MADVAWPLGLPMPGDVQSDVPTETRVSTSTEIGPGKVRARYTASVRRVTYRWVLDGEGRNAFDAFFYGALENGTKTFDFIDPKDDRVVAARFAVGQVPNWAIVRGGSPEERTWSTTVIVEILPGAP